MNVADIVKRCYWLIRASIIDTVLEDMRYYTVLAHTLIPITLMQRNVSVTSVTALLLVPSFLSQLRYRRRAKAKLLFAGLFKEVLCGGASLVVDQRIVWLIALR